MAEILSLGAVISEEDDERAKRWARVKRCRRCGTTFRFYIGDLILHGDGYGGSSIWDPYVKCPNCDTEHMVWLVMPWVRRLAYEDYGKKCNNCDRPQREHSADGKCLFEASHFNGTKRA